MAGLKEITVLLVVAVALAQCRNLDVQEKSQSSTRIKQYFEINGSEYYIDSDAWMQFKDAKADCEGRDARLVSFTSQEKYDEVLQWLKARGLQWQWYWTGGHRDAGSINWLWTTSDKPITSFLWAADRPSVQNLPEERCITFSYDSKGWDDGKCNDFFPHICEKTCL